MDITTLPLQAPTSPMAVYELLGKYEAIPLRVLPAALGICCPSLKVRATYSGDVAKYGAAVFDELVMRGVPGNDIFKRGAEAFAMVGGVIERLPSNVEVDEREGFSEAAAPSTSS